jgi:hypothetical protein
MTSQRDLKARIRARQKKTGESYMTARMHVMAEVSPNNSRPAEQSPPLLHPAAAPPTGPDLAGAEALLNAAFVAEPRLRSNGIEYESAAATDPAKLAKARVEMMGHLDEVAAAARWLRAQKPSEKFNPFASSYGFKHQAERWSKEHGGAPYISNGALIAAAIGLGFKVRHIPRTLNVEMALDERALRGLPPRELTPFYLWLMQFIREESPRGDVARDAQRDFEDLEPPGSIGLRGFWDGRASQLLRRTRGTAAEPATVGLLVAYRQQRDDGKRPQKPSLDLTWKQLGEQLGEYLAELAKAATKRPTQRA